VCVAITPPLPTLGGENHYVLWSSIRPSGRCSSVVRCPTVRSSFNT